MIWVFYYALSYLIVFGVRISMLWNSKSRLWIRGRKNWKEEAGRLPQKKSERVWFHVSSLGEFEQARPVIEKLKAIQPRIEIILTFFSPSGFTIRSGYELARVLYLPADLPGRASNWLDLIQPDLAVFVKYDLWPGYLKALQQKGIPSILISAHWIPGGYFNSWSVQPVKSLLKKFNAIFLQSNEHMDYFKEKGFTNLKVAGDTRIDRSLSLPSEADQRLPAFLKAKGGFDLIAGSTWPPDEKILLEAITQLHLKVIIAPHDISEENINRIIRTFPFTVCRLSEMDEADLDARVIIVDSIGLLSVLYALGKIAYVGGGFGSGIHNTLEPMAHHKPLIFGPAYGKFPEAVAMVNQKGAYTVSSGSDLIRAIHHLQLPGIAERAGKMARDYLQSNAGATDIVVKYIMESIPYTGKS